MEVRAMFRVIGLQIKSGLKSARQPRGILYIVLAFVLLIGSAPQTAPVSAAQGGWGQVQISYLIRVIKPKQPICVGRDYKVTVKITKFYERRAETNSAEAETDWSRSLAEPMDNRTVKGSVEDPSIGTLTPDVMYTGFPYGEGGPGEATFKFHANKAGTTLLIFQTDISGYNNNGPIDGRGGESIKVVNCSYKVNMNAFDIVSGGGVTIWSSGILVTKITGDEGQLNGTGTFNFDSGFTGPPCSISYSSFQNSTTITGQVDQENDKLVLNFQYQPGTVTSSVSCPDVPRGQGSQVVNLTDTGITQATFPASGGTKVFPFSIAGSVGTMTITVAPVPAGE
jgi:hypothetical protein